MPGAPRKKLIEVALPLEAINKEAAREKSIRHGHPSTLHLWWARRPLAACRAVLFASLVDDPGDDEAERQRLFRIIEDLVKWENSTNETVLEAARAEIRRCTGGKPPPVLDPFCGGGSIPLEAQRLGLEAHASDLNPVAVLITKALIEIPPRFAGRPPVNPDARARLDHSGAWKGAQGLADDVRYYGRWMRDEAEMKIGRLYPKIRLPKTHGGGDATVIAWLWARTVKCPNPACGATMPLVRSFALSTKEGREVSVEPVIDRKKKTVRFEIKKGKPPDGTVNRHGARCIVCDQPVPFDHVRAEGKAGRMSQQLMAIVAEGKSGRVYLPPDEKHVEIARSAEPTWKPDAELPHNPRDFKTPNYGMKTFADLFTPRQLVALTTFSDLVAEARKRVLADAKAAGLPADDKPLRDGGAGARAYAEAVGVYLSFALSKQADLGNRLCRWEPIAQCPRQLFARQAIPMIWDFAEGNPTGDSSGAWVVFVDGIARALSKCFEHARTGMRGHASQADSRHQAGHLHPMFSTDPPYYDNIGYADLSDFFYVWLRRSLNDVYPDLFKTIAVPKTEELVATPYRFGGSKEKARDFFEEGFGRAFGKMREAQHPDYPLTVFYAFKQSEEDGDDAETEKNGSAIASTGWETMLEGLLKSGFSIDGTWPIRTENASRMVGQGTNALASSIVLACRPRPADAPTVARRDFLKALKAELPSAIRTLEKENIAPVDLAQASIGPGMAVFSRYAKVLEADGTPMSVRTALQIINQALDEYLAAAEGDLDADTRFCIAWFDQFGHEARPFGEADVLARAKNTSVRGLDEAGVLESRAGKVRLLKRDEYADDWNPGLDRRITAWEATQHLIRRLKAGGEEAAARLAADLGPAKAEEARALAYRLYQICDRRKWADEALAYNGLVVEWTHVQRAAADLPPPSQPTLDFGGPAAPEKSPKPTPAKSARTPRKKVKA